MRITIVLGAFFPVPPIMGGAVEKGWFALAREFARRGHEVTEISRAVPQFPERETIDGVQHVRVPGSNSPKSLVWLKLLDLIYSLRVRSVLPPADVLVTNTFWLPMLLRNGSRGKIYVHVARFPKGQMRFYRHAARLQTPSRSVADAVAAEVPESRDKVVVVPYPRPEARSQQALPPPISARENVILYVGRVHPEKGVHLLVEAFTRAPDEMFRGWKAVIVGPVESKFGGGGDEYLRRLKDIAGDRREVEWRGAIFDDAELEREYGAAKIFVYPSLAERGETFGLAPLEAMAHSCAVLVSSLGCFGDFIRDRETGFIFDHRSAAPVDTLRTQLRHLVADDALLTRVAEAGYRKACEFTAKAVAAQFLQDFEKLA
jgi:glycosyltransferase involved in cell wall biosynthesis